MWPVWSASPSGRESSPAPSERGAERLAPDSEMSDDTTTSERRGRWLAWGVLLLCAVLLALRFRYHTCDDAFISFRYARNLVEGHGLVFNPGERVEGYTNFVWVLLAALFMKIGIDPVLALKWLLAGAGGGTLWLSARLE